MRDLLLTLAVVAAGFGLAAGIVEFAEHQQVVERPDVRLVRALDAYCPAVDYRDEICQVQLPQGFGE